MYDLVHEQMVNSSIAINLPESEWYWIDNNGEQAQNKEDTVGNIIKFEITHPNWLLFGDKVRSKLSM